MRIERVDTPEGRLYKIYRSGPEFVDLMKRLVPFFVGSGCDVLIGGSDDDPDVVITFGPADDETVKSFERRLRH